MACGSSGHRAPSLADDPVLASSGVDGGLGASGGSGSGGSTGNDPTGGTGGDAGSGGSAGSAGPASSDAGGAVDAGPVAPPDVCGDGMRSGGEDCDGASPASRSCRNAGFDVGDMTCNADCTWNTDTCSGNESCQDGRDNDGDGLVDCDDLEDCGDVCQNACLAPPRLAENTSVQGSTLGHSSVVASSCSEAAPSGSEVAYRVDVTETAKLDVTLSTPDPLSVSVRTSCGVDVTEIACGRSTRLTLDVTEGEIYLVVVDGIAEGDSGNYTLSVDSRQQACGDAIRDLGEQCDDGNIADGDGCDPDCFVESNETEPNDSLAAPNVYDFSPWVAEIEPAGDADYYRVSLAATSSTLVVSALNLGDGACGLNLMDTVVEVYGEPGDGFPLLVSDDDGGDGGCSRAVATGLSAGDYTVVVRAAAGAEPATFPYRLGVSVGVCGDGDVSLGEECDDGNLDAGDGCDATCGEEE